MICCNAGPARAFDLQHAKPLPMKELLSRAARDDRMINAGKCG